MAYVYKVHATFSAYSVVRPRNHGLAHDAVFCSFDIALKSAQLTNFSATASQKAPQLLVV